MSTKIYEIENYENYGKCAIITDGTIEMFVTLDLGPRIIRYAFCGEKNVFYNDLSRKMVRDDKIMQDYYGDDYVWNLYGGHRFWISPESLPETYYPDNDPLTYETDGNSIIINQPDQKKNNLSLSLKITLENGIAKVTHIVKNVGKETKKISLWALSVMNKNGIAIIPYINKNQGEFLPDRNLVFWWYSDMNDSRISYGKDFAVIKQDENAKGPFKIGFKLENPKTAYINGDTAFVLSFDSDFSAEYPDSSSNFESYTGADMLEMETLSPLYTLSHGEQAVHSEYWSLKKISITPDYNNNNEEEIKKLFEVL